MSIHKSASRIHVTGRLSQGDSITLSKDQSHYLIRVMRRSPGDTVIVFNGRDGEWQTSIDQSSKSSCTLLIDHQLRPQSNEPDIWLAFAPIKKTRLDFLIEKATELGVSKLLPVITHHTDVGRINRDRLQATAIEASEQCERLSIPTVEEAVSFDQLLEHWPENRRLLYLDETGQGDPLAVIINQNSTDGVLDGIFVGPGDLGLRIERCGADFDLEQAIEKVAALCKQYNKPWGLPIADIEVGKKRYDQGARLLAYGGEFMVLKEMLEKNAAELSTLE